MFYFLALLFSYGTLHASAPLYINLEEDKSVQYSVKDLSGKTVHISPPDGHLYKVSVKLLKSEKEKIRFFLEKVSQDDFQRRLDDQKAVARQVSSGKVESIRFERKNLSLSGEAGTCHLITQKATLSDIIVCPRDDSETTAASLSLGFENSILRLKLTPRAANTPFWVQGILQPKTIQIDTKPKNFGSHRTLPELSPFQIISLTKPLEFIGASLEARLVMALSQ